MITKMLFVNKGIVWSFVHFLDEIMFGLVGLIYCALFLKHQSIFYDLSMIVKISYKSYMTLYEC